MLIVFCDDVLAFQETPTSGYGSGLVGRVFLSCPPKCEPVWHSGPAVFLVSSFASGIILMSLPDPNAAAPAPQPAEVIATTDEIEKKRIELKSMLSGFIASGKLHFFSFSENFQFPARRKIADLLYPFVYAIAFAISPKKGFFHTTSCMLCI